MQGSAGYCRKTENWTAKQECQDYEKQCRNLFKGAQFFANKKFEQAQQQARHQNATTPYRNPSHSTIPSRPSLNFLPLATRTTNRAILGQ